MAKSGFWLQGSKGKLSGASLSTGKNGTIIRTIVTPKNPRTDKQMSQRVIFATIAKAASVMKPIINHSFEGIEDGDACIKEFRKLNLYKLRNQIAYDQQEEELNAYVAPKGYPFITPDAYIVSRGSLASPLLGLEVDDHAVAFSAINVLLDGDDLTVQELIQLSLGMNPGEQLSLCYINAQINDNLYYSAGEMAGEKCYENAFGSRRIVFIGDSNTAAWNHSVFNNNTFDLDTVKAVIDWSKTDTVLFDKIFGRMNVVAEDDEIHIDTTSVVVDSASTKAAALIRSQMKSDGSWLYSNATMFLCSPDADAHNYGLPLEDAVKTYTAGVSVGKDERPFLDEGRNGGTLSMSSFE